MINEEYHYKCIDHDDYKYELLRDVYSWCGLGEHAFSSEFMELKRDGTLIVKKGYRWDGCSGPTWDTDNTMHGGLIHDVLYQAMREGLLHGTNRKTVDLLFYKLLRDDGMNWFRANYYYYGVRIMGKQYAKLMILLVLLELTSCIQVNIGSSVVNVSSQKVMYNSKGQIVGSELKDNVADLKSRADLKK